MVRVEARERRGRLRPRESPDARQSLGRRAAALAPDARARRLDPPRRRAAAPASARHLPAPRRRDHRRDVRRRAGDGGRTARVPAGARGRRRRVSRPGVWQRAAAGRVGQRVPGSDRQRTDRRADPAERRASAAWVRTRSGRRGPASAARFACCSRTSAAPCPASARWRTTAVCATRTWSSPRTRRTCPPGWAPHGTERHGFAPGQNSISLAFANGATNIRRRGAKKETPEEDALQGMHRMADFMRVPNMPGLAGLRARHSGHPDDSRRGGPDHGRPRVDQGRRSASSSGSIREFPPRICGAPDARRGSRSTRARWCARASRSTRGRSPSAPTTS